VKSSNELISALIRWEDVKPKAYKDSSGKWTIGVGHLITENEKALLTKTLTEAEIFSLLQTDLLRFENKVNKVITVPLTQTQYDSLVALSFNIGDNAFAASSVVKRINAKYPLDKIEEAFLMWNKERDPKTKKLVLSPGLVNRRNKEVHLFRYGIYK